MVDDIEGWDHVKKALGGPIITREEEPGEELDQDSPVSVNVPVGSFFRPYFEEGKPFDEIVNDSEFSEEKIKEALDYSVDSVENLHEVARGVHNNRKLFEGASGGLFGEKADMSLSEGDSVEFVDYLGGEMADVQDVVEEQASSRDFKIRYSPDEDQLYRSDQELHVLANEDSDEEVYIGVEDGQVYVGSTSSAIEQEFSEIDDAEFAFKQKLNSLAYQER